MTREKIKKEIARLRTRAKGCLEERVSVGRGFRPYTDELLRDAENYESQAKVLQKILDE